MLGEHVLGLKARNKEGEVIAAPEFDLMLSYDYQIRRQMVKLVKEGATIAEALKEAMTDTTIKERHFLTPNVYSQVSSTASASKGDYQRSRSPPWRRGSWNTDFYEQPKGKGKGKKGGKGKTKKGRQMHDRTPDGRQICWRWNNPRERCRFQCGRLHVCQLCFGSHPAHACDGSGGSKDTAGAAADASKSA